MLSERLLFDLSAQRTRKALPLQRQLAEALRRAILRGDVAPGERLPSSRALMRDLGLSRNTVMAALAQLSTEGFLQARVGSGTRVRADVQPHTLGAATRPVPQARPLSARGRQLSERFCADALEVQPFTPGSPDFSAFARTLWQRLQAKHWRLSYPEMLDYSSAGGYGPLRRAIADYVRVFRSVPLEVEQVIVTSGTQESLALCAQLLADAGDTVWLEDPAYWGAVKAFMAAGLTPYGVAVDAHGWTLPPPHAPAPRMVYVTPSHQYPTGAVMSLERRQQLLQCAAQHQAWVLEDDYDSEFRFGAAPQPALAALDTHQQVIYLGSFSKVMYPGLKLGYLVVPTWLAADFKRVHYDLHRPGQIPVQAALAEFIDSGHFAHALRKARQSHAQRRAALLQALQPCLDANVRITGAEQGLHLCLQLPLSVDDQALAQHLAQQQLLVRPLSAYALQRRDVCGLVIGYGYAQADAIAPLGRQLALGLRAALRGGRFQRRGSVCQPESGR
ncbi:MAG: PLP-dependent aminotransferase family protein [Rhodoferax sp.]